MQSYNCYRSGAPVRRCESMVPGHFAPAPSKPSPFELIPGKVIVNGSEVVQFTLSAENNETLKGFLIRLQAKNPIDEAEIHNMANMGFFKISDEDAQIQKLDCFDVPSSAITHVSNVPKESLDFPWIAPRVDEDTEFEVL